ncbi:MAG: PfkB family carbohydrate kinase [Clostridia bacterium]|nr:PfkB family carbohydrate kinase [Clostridia bacterium]
MVLLVSPHNVVKKDYFVNNFKVNELNKLSKKTYSIYSQGINISTCLKVLQTEPFLLTFFGGVNGKHVKNHLHVNRIKFDSVHMAMNSYEKINIIDEESKTHTIINDFYSKVDDKIAQNYFNIYKESLKRCQFVVFEDRLNEYVDNEMVIQMAREADKSNIRTVLDVKSDIGLDYVKAVKPYLVKYNKKSLEQSNIRWDDINNLKSFTLDLIDSGIHYVLIDLHEDGVLLFSKKHFLMVDTKVLERNFEYLAEATDALLAGFLTGLSKDYEEEKTLKLAYSSECAVFTYGSIENLNRKNIFDLRKYTKVRMHNSYGEKEEQ